MNMHKIFYRLLIPTITIFALPASAVIIEGTFKGIIYDAWDYHDGSPTNPYPADFWSGDLTGKSLSGKFWYDTDLAPANSGATGTVRSSETNNWMNITFLIDGKNLEVSRTPDNLPIRYAYEILAVDEEGYMGALEPAFSQFDMVDFVLSGDENVRHWQHGGLAFLEGVLPLDGNNVIQQFSWADNGDEYSDPLDYPGLAYYYTSSYSNDWEIIAEARARITEFTIGIKDVTVPEPASLLLIMMGLVGIMLGRTM